MNSPLISPLLNDDDLVLLQEDWADPITIGDTSLLFHHEAIVADADHPYRSEPAPAPLGTDLDRVPGGPTLIADGPNRLSDFPFDAITRVTWRMCFGELLVTVVEEALNGAGLDDRLGVDWGATDCAAQKGFSVARTTFPGGMQVDVYNLHAEAGSGSADQIARQDNFRQLAEFMNGFSPGNALILGGDTNLHTEPDTKRSADTEIWMDFLSVTGLVDVCAVVDCGDDAGRIDTFAFRAGDAVAVSPLSRDVEDARFTRADSSAATTQPDALPVALPRTGDSVRRAVGGLVLALGALTLARARTTSRSCRWPAREARP